MNDVIERGKIRRGDVLVVKRADTEWNEIIQEVEALILEMGGKVSHGPMVARRIGIPCVSGTFILASHHHQILAIFLMHLSVDSP